MREILYKYVLKNKHTGVLHTKVYSIVEIEKNGLAYLFDFENYELVARLECTGLNDKNGAKIFEGDKYEVNGVVREVSYIHGAFCAYGESFGHTPLVWDIDNISLGLVEDLHFLQQIKIIGNIHEGAQ